MIRKRWARRGACGRECGGGEGLQLDLGWDRGLRCLYTQLDYCASGRADQSDQWVSLPLLASFFFCKDLFLLLLVFWVTRYICFWFFFLQVTTLPLNLSEHAIHFHENSMDKSSRLLGHNTPIHLWKQQQTQCDYRTFTTGDGPTGLVVTGQVHFFFKLSLRKVSGYLEPYPFSRFLLRYSTRSPWP